MSHKPTATESDQPTTDQATDPQGCACPCMGVIARVTGQQPDNINCGEMMSAMKGKCAKAMRTCGVVMLLIVAGVIALVVAT